MASKFKVGDRVRAIDQHYHWGRVKKGDIGTVSAVGSDKLYVDFEAQSLWTADESDLELVQSTLKLVSGHFPPNTRSKDIGAKIGDRFRVVQDDSFKKGDIVELIREDSSICPKFERVTDGIRLYEYYYNLAPIQGEYMPDRRTFKLLKDTPTHKKGTLFQEQCEDGTQPYSALDQPEYTIADRSLVEDAPEFFVEVFQVQPPYMTREELDRYNQFVGIKKAANINPVTGKRAYKKRSTTKKRGGTWTPERRAAQSRKMKAYYRRHPRG